MLDSVPLFYHLLESIVKFISCQTSSFGHYIIWGDKITPFFLVLPPYSSKSHFCRGDFLLLVIALASAACPSSVLRKSKRNITTGNKKNWTFIAILQRFFGCLAITEF